MSSPTVRAATVDDASAIAVAHMRGWQVAYRGMVPDAYLDGIVLEERTKQWHQNLEESTLPNGLPAPANHVAEVDGQVVGFACVGVDRDRPDDATAGELWAMYVHPDYWGTGAGFALMQTTMDLFRHDGVESACLWVLEANDRARRFYERQGWSADDATKSESIGGADIIERRYGLVL